MTNRIKDLALTGMNNATRLLKGNERETLSSEIENYFIKGIDSR